MVDTNPTVSPPVAPEFPDLPRQSSQRQPMVLPHESVRSSNTCIATNTAFSGGARVPREGNFGCCLTETSPPP